MGELTRFPTNLSGLAWPGNFKREAVPPGKAEREKQKGKAQATEEDKGGR